MIANCVKLLSPLVRMFPDSGEGAPLLHCVKVLRLINQLNISSWCIPGFSPFRPCAPGHESGHNTAPRCCPGKRVSKAPHKEENTANLPGMVRQLQCAQNPVQQLLPCFHLPPHIKAKHFALMFKLMSVFQAACKRLVKPDRNPIHFPIARHEPQAQTGEAWTGKPCRAKCFGLSCPQACRAFQRLRRGVKVAQTILVRACAVLDKPATRSINRSCFAAPCAGPDSRTLAYRSHNRRFRSKFS